MWKGLFFEYVEVLKKNLNEFIKLFFKLFFIIVFRKYKGVVDNVLNLFNLFVGVVCGRFFLWLFFDFLVGCVWVVEGFIICFNIDY